MAKEYSPFSPGVPLAPELFAGRQAEVEHLIEACRRAQSGRFERTFVLGERGIGKSSLCRFVRQFADRELSMLGLHVFLGNIDTPEDVVAAVLSQLAESSADRPWYDKLKSLFKDHLREVGLFGVSLRFEADEPELKTLTADFPRALSELMRRLGADRRGLLLIMDDLNGLARSQRFADWLKSFVDSVATNHPIPLHLVLAGIPERRTSLVELQPSLNRVFDLLEAGPIAHTETVGFLKSAFAKARVDVDTQALVAMADFSGGYPVLMQEIGDAVYRMDTDAHVTYDEAIAGIVEAAEIVGRKYLNAEVVEAIRSEQYRSILSRVVSNSSVRTFRRRELLPQLSDNEQRSFDNFIRRMKDLDVIDAVREGEYQFKNSLHWLYYSMQFASRDRTTSGGAA